MPFDPFQLDQGNAQGDYGGDNTEIGGWSASELAGWFGLDDWPPKPLRITIPAPRDSLPWWLWPVLLIGAGIWFFRH